MSSQGLLLMWLCSKGSLPQSPCYPGTRDTWGASQVVAQCDYCRWEERTFKMFYVSQFLVLVLDLWWKAGCVL